MKIKILVALALAPLVGCATGYQTGRHFTGGFDEVALAPNVYRVRFVGNGYTSGTRAEDFALLRSADLTLQKGFHFFALSDSSSKESVSSFVTPSVSTTTANVQAYGNSAYGTAQTTTTGGQTIFVSKPSSSNIVVMFAEKPALNGMVFDAAFICQSLGTKYKTACGTK